MTDPGSDLVSGWLSHSPLSGTLGLTLESIEPGRARVLLPFADHICTLPEVVHGGAIASLIDTAATAAAWAGAEVPANGRGSTVALTVNYVGPARKTDLRATGTVVKRGKNLVYVDVDVVDGEDAIVAKGLVTYKLG